MSASIVEKNELYGLKGWLAFMGIGILFSPVKILYEMIQTFQPVLNRETWFALTTKGMPSYHPMWAPLLIGEIAFNILLFTSSLLLVYFYLSKNHRFPALYITIMVASILFIPADASLVKAVLPSEPLFDATGLREYLQLLLTALIWIPYVLFSRRVRTTFAHQRKDETAEQPAPGSP